MQQVERKLKNYGVLALKGMAMGAADVVPGVSGGTVALITGIYSELIDSLRRLNPLQLTILFRAGTRAFWAEINGNFLLAVFGGILLSIKTLASAVGFALETYPLLVWGFFSGLILGSSVLMLRHQPHWKMGEIVCCGAGAVLVLAIGIIKPMEVSATYPVLFMGGFIAICAMILPGISGSFLLLLMGLYPAVLRAVNEFNILALLVFASGCGVGLMVFSRFLGWLLQRFYAKTLATMIGFLFGSLYTTWPWKQVLTYSLDRHGDNVPLYQRSVWPWDFSGDPQILLVLLSVLLGVVLVLAIEFLAGRLEKSIN